MGNLLCLINGTKQIKRIINVGRYYQLHFILVIFLIFFRVLINRL